MIDRQTFDMEDAGVSPVVGVILMVAVTVILAAVIGTFVLDLGSDVGQNAQAGVTFDEDAGTSVDVQLNSVQTADSIWVTAGENAVFSSTAAGDTAETGGADDEGQILLDREENGGVGATVTVTAAENETLEEGTISVIGEVDGESSVLQTYNHDEIEG